MTEECSRKNCSKEAVIKGKCYGHYHGPIGTGRLRKSSTSLKEKTGEEDNQ